MKLQWEKPDFEALVAGTETWCPFCADKVLEVTPRFPQTSSRKAACKKTTW